MVGRSGGEDYDLLMLVVTFSGSLWDKASDKRCAYIGVGKGGEAGGAQIFTTSFRQ